MTTASRRIQLEYSEMSDLWESEGISAGPIDDSDFLKWLSVIAGPPGTPYEGGVFNVEIDFPPNYPYNPPRVRFQTIIFHPNISSEGEVGLNILQEDWSSALTIDKVLLSVRSLLTSPLTDDNVMNLEAGRLYREDLREYEETARSWTVGALIDAERDSINAVPKESPEFFTPLHSSTINVAISSDTLP